MEDTFVTYLYDLVELELDEVLQCGILGFKLTDATMAELLIVEADGMVTLVSPVINDEGWIGLHSVTFEVFLIDLDPEAEAMTWTLDFSISI